MPLYRYLATHPGRCPDCRDGFERLQKVGEPALTECPTCGNKVGRTAAEATFAPKILRTPGHSEAKAAGFTVYKKLGQGEYERQ